MGEKMLAHTTKANISLTLDSLMMILPTLQATALIITRIKPIVVDFPGLSISMQTNPIAAKKRPISCGHVRLSRNNNTPQPSVKNALNCISRAALPGGTPIEIPRLINAHMAAPKINPYATSQRSATWGV
ncbi:hypothetical protein ERHA55_53370 (plasmid) [Erwinia rhapontici]|nr:hypothetical protein ERHA55_53370 [Erwinia rhapontici]